MWALKVDGVATARFSEMHDAFVFFMWKRAGSVFFNGDFVIDLDLVSSSVDAAALGEILISLAEELVDSPAVGSVALGVDA